VSDDAISLDKISFFIYYIR